MRRAFEFYEFKFLSFSSHSAARTGGDRKIRFGDDEARAAEAKARSWFENYYGSTRHLGLERKIRNRFGGTAGAREIAYGNRGLA